MRHSSGKDYLQVLDFVALLHKRYRVDRKFAALLPGNRYNIEKELEHGFPHVPPGWVVPEKGTGCFSPRQAFVVPGWHNIPWRAIMNLGKSEDGGNFLTGADCATETIGNIERKFSRLGDAGVIRNGLFHGPMGTFGRGEVTLVAAKPGQGKTGFLVSSLCYMLKKKLSVMVFTPGGTPGLFMERLIAAAGNADYSGIRTGALEREEWPRITRGAFEFCESKLWFSNRRTFSLEQVCNDAWFLANTLESEKQRLDAVVIDPLNSLMCGEREAARLSAFAAETGVAVICSLNADCAGCFTLGDLQSLGISEWDLGAALYLRRATGDNSMAEAQPLWGLGQGRCKLAWNPHTCAFEALPEKSAKQGELFPKKRIKK